MCRKRSVVNVTSGIIKRICFKLCSLLEDAVKGNLADGILLSGGLGMSILVAAGEPRSVISEDLLREVYGVEAEVKWDGAHNYSRIIPKTKKIPKEEIVCLR